jgi:hypothetical protein
MPDLCHHCERIAWEHGAYRVVVVRIAVDYRAPDQHGASIEGTITAHSHLCEGAGSHDEAENGHAEGAGNGEESAEATARRDTAHQPPRIDEE